MKPFGLIGHDAGWASFEAARASGRVHHAWLLAGPRGIGKTLFAEMMARSLLGGLDEDSPVGRAISQRAHGDYRVLGPREDKPDGIIPVDDVRDLLGFFSLMPSQGGWRIAIVDPIDQLNASGANALLKTLEEPPRQTILILVSHNEMPVLPTIRSRCRQLRLDRLSQEETQSVLERQTLDAAEVKLAARLSPGQPGLGLTLIGPDSVAAVDAMDAALTAMPQLNVGLLDAACATAGKSTQAFEAAGQAALRFLHANGLSATDPSDGEVWAKLHSDTLDAMRQARELNMELSGAVLHILLHMQRALRQLVS
jgi:DNA polymerase III subunit delta'